MIPSTECGSVTSLASIGLWDGTGNNRFVTPPRMVADIT